MQRLNRWLILSIGASLLIGLVGCAHTMPESLRQANEAYQAAQSGPAATYAKDSLAQAKTELDVAQHAWKKGMPDDQVNLLSYQAQRQAQIAQAQGNTRQILLG